MATAKRGAPPAREVELRARRIRIVACDLDGVLTDGRILRDARGRELRAFHVDDGIGAALLTRAGIRLLLLSAGPVAHGRKLGADTITTTAGQGLVAVDRWCRRRRLPLAAVAYVGRDVLELPLLAAVGLSVAVANASPEVKRRAHWVTRASGGTGVLREVVERVLRSQGRWGSTLGETWRQWD